MKWARWYFSFWLGAMVSCAATAASQEKQETDYSVSNVLFWCREPPSTKDYEAKCRGLIVGVAEVMRGGNTINGVRACFHPVVTRPTLWDRTVLEIAISKLRSVESDEVKIGGVRYDARPAEGIIALGLAEAFPCKN